MCDDSISNTRQHQPSDLSYRAVRTARVLTRLPDGEHVIILDKKRGSFDIEVKASDSDKPRKWSF